MNNIFSINRLWLLIKRDFAELSKSVAYISIGIYLTLLFINVYSYIHSAKYIFAQDNPERYIYNRNDDLMALNVIIFVIFLAYLCGKALYSKSKGERIVFNTLPSTNVEKFASRLILRVAGGVVLFMLIALAADASKGLFVSLFVDVKQYISLYVTDIPSWLMKEIKDDLFLSISETLVIYSFFLFSSSFWHKNPMGHAGLIIVLLVFIITNLIDFIEITISHDNITTITYFITFGLFALAICLLVLSYRFFTTDSIKERKVY